MKNFSILLAVLLFVSVSCVMEEPNDMEADVKAVADVSEKVVEAWNNGDYETFMNYLDEDAVLLPQSAPSLVGIEPIKALYSNSFNSFTFTVEETIAEINVCGDYAYAMGNWTGSMNPVDGSSPVEFDNKILAIYKRQADGSWLVYRNMYNSNTIPQEKISPELAE
jgi:uncharacterized protein (TIGR02246 family)